MVAESSDDDLSPFWLKASRCFAQPFVPPSLTRGAEDWRSRAVRRSSAAVIVQRHGALVRKCHHNRQTCRVAGWVVTVGMRLW